ncbi:MAG: hypothetical protein GY744_18075 [Gammaproteobacteria bacterium]|nr:hypothetical protein [Gammaproteobacteria bacterium]
MYQIAVGYEDAKDCDELRGNRIFKIRSGKLPQSGGDLVSQPTMSRFENSVSRSELYRIAKHIASCFINSYEPEVIIIDCHDTNINVHGNQLQIEYNHYYGEYCFMPLHIYEGLSGELITTILKP